MPGPGKPSTAVHWYSLVEPTVIDFFVAATVFDGVQLPPLTVPQVALPVLWERSVAQATVAELATTSERYGYRFSADETAADPDDNPTAIDATTATIATSGPSSTPEPTRFSARAANGSSARTLPHAAAFLTSRHVSCQMAEPNPQSSGW